MERKNSQGLVPVPFFKDINFLFGLALMLPYLFLLFFSTYEAAYDEVYQLEATARLSIAQGYTASWETPYDLSTPYFSYLSAWPIGYSFFILILVKAGFSLTAAAKFYKAVLLMFTFITWFSFSRLFEKSKRTDFFFAGLLSIFSVVCARSVNDLFIIAVVGVFSTVLFKYDQTLYGYLQSRKRGLRLYFFTGLLLGVGMSLKYSAISLALAGAIWIVYNEYKSIARTVVCLFAYALPFTLIMSLIFINNYQHTQNISTLTTQWSIENVTHVFKIPYIAHIKAVIFDSMQIPLIAGKGISIFFPLAGKIFSNTLFVLLAIYLCYAFYSLKRKKGAGEKLVYLLLTLYISISSFLFVNTILFHADVTHWTPFIEGRYFTPLAPLLILALFLTPLPFLKSMRANNFVRHFGTGAVILFCAVVMMSYTARRFNPSALIGREMQMVTKSREILLKESRIKEHIIFMDQPIFTAWPRDGLTNVFCNIPPFSKNAFFSKKTLIIVFCSYIDYYNLDKSKTRALDQQFINFAKANNFTGIDISSNTTMFWKVYEPGPLQLKLPAR